MSLLLVVHVLAAGLWLGCLATEIAFEKAMEGDPAARDFVSRLHDRVDRLVEGPAFVIVAATGLVMLPQAVWTTGLVVKIGLGGVAVLLNVWCLKIVFDRADAARQGCGADWERIDRLQHVVGGGVAVALVAAAIVAVARVV